MKYLFMISYLNFFNNNEYIWHYKYLSKKCADIDNQIDAAHCKYNKNETKYNNTSYSFDMIPAIRYQNINGVWTLAAYGSYDTHSSSAAATNLNTF